MVCRKFRLEPLNGRIAPTTAVRSNCDAPREPTSRCPTNSAVPGGRRSPDGATILDADSPSESSMERYGGGSIVVSDYNPAWPATFEQERTSLHTALGPLVLTIEHIGSTAVPGLAAKPIIDLQLSVRSLAEARSSCVGPLQALGYAYMPEYEARLPGKLFFRKGQPWTHHLHVLQGDHPGGGAAFCFVTICATIPK